jgi:hypothetical protein
LGNDLVFVSPWKGSYRLLAQDLEKQPSKQQRTLLPARSSESQNGQLARVNYPIV